MAGHSPVGLVGDCVFVVTESGEMVMSVFINVYRLKAFTVSFDDESFERLDLIATERNEERWQTLIRVIETGLIALGGQLKYGE